MTILTINLEPMLLKVIHSCNSDSEIAPPPTPPRHFPIILVKVEFYAPSNARFLPPKCSNYAHFSKLCSFGLKNALLYFKEIHSKQALCVFYVNSVN